MKHHSLKILVLTLALAGRLHALETWWPQFRGPNCSGVSATAKPPTEFGPGTNQLWKISAPAGMSSPCVWNDRIFLTGFRDGKLVTSCYQRGDGKVLWEREAKAKKLEEFHRTEGSPAASTPAADGERVVSYFGSCGLVCYDFKGKELWQHELPTAETAGSFGSGGSPMIVGGLVLVNRDQLDSCSLLAVDVKTGRKAWETPRPDVTQSFGTPMVWKNDGVEEIVMSGSLKIKGYDVKTGVERWSLAGMPSFTCTTPVVGDGMLYFAGWSPGKGDGSMPTFEGLAARNDLNKDGIITMEEAKTGGLDSYFKSFDMNRDGKITAEDLEVMKAKMAKGENVLVAVKAGGRGELNESFVVWKQTRGLPYVSSPLHYDGRVYLVKDGGMVSCFDAKTGRPYYQQERLDALGNYYASPVAADGRIYVTSLNGKFSVLAAGGDTPRVLHRAEFGERVSGTPALVEKAIYVRTASALYAFGM